MSTISKNKKNKIVLEVIGGNAENVTGSCTKITYNNNTILFEFGIIQEGRSVKDNYDLNKKLINSVKVKNIKYIFLGHSHADHSCNIPSLYSKGCQADIIVPRGTSKILKEIWSDSAHINVREAERLSKSDRNYTPHYTEEEVRIALNHIKEYDFHELIKLDEEVCFRFSHAGHILLSAQTELFITVNNHTKKILFTSDLGNVKLNKTRLFLDPFEPVVKSNIVIGETTYAAKNRSMSKKKLQEDLNKIKSVIQEFCVEKGNIVVAPTFSLDRTPYMLWLIYSIFGHDSDFKIPILVDSPLAIRLLDTYSTILTGEKKELFDKMMNWKNIKLIYSSEDSKSAMADNKPKVVLSSSGMLKAGRSVMWVRNILPKSEHCILFTGFAASNSLACKIKNGKEKKSIVVGGVPVKNKCNIVDLCSFSSHMQRDDLIKYYSNIVCEKIYLVHGNKEDRIEFKKDLCKEIRRKLRTTKVAVVNKGTKITI